MTIVDFRKLDAWQKSDDLSIKIFKLTKSLPDDERYEMVSQLRRASTSISANIAEGFARYKYPDKRAKYVIARGELVEVMSHLIYCKDVEYISENSFNDINKDCTEVYKLINGLIAKMNTSANSKTPKPLTPKPLKP